MHQEVKPLYLVYPAQEQDYFAVNAVPLLELPMRRQLLKLFGVKGRRNQFNPVAIHTLRS